jgi:hypothetical protein
MSLFNFETIALAVGLEQEIHSPPVFGVFGKFFGIEFHISSTLKWLMRTEGWRDRGMEGRRDRETEGRRDRGTERQRDRRTEGRRDKRTEGRRDRETEGRRART